VTFAFPLFGLASLCVAQLGAQVTDTTPAAPRTPSLAVPGSAGRPPITPRRAFLYSLAAPGSAQSILGRPTAGSIFVASEAGILSMIAKSVYDLRAARALANDSVIVRYGPDTTRGPDIYPFRALTAGAQRARSRIGARSAHVEDWITILIVNHFLAGADAYVAANLWDVPADVGISATADRGMQLRARIAW
jgi:hypothetical protein